MPKVNEKNLFFFVNIDFVSKVPDCIFDDQAFVGCIPIAAVAVDLKLKS